MPEMCFEPPTPRSTLKTQCAGSRSALRWRFHFGCGMVCGGSSFPIYLPHSSALNAPPLVPNEKAHFSSFTSLLRASPALAALGLPSSALVRKKAHYVGAAPDQLIKGPTLKKSTALLGIETLPHASTGP